MKKKKYFHLIAISQKAEFIDSCMLHLLLLDLIPIDAISANRSSSFRPGTNVLGFDNNKEAQIGDRWIRII